MVSFMPVIVIVEPLEDIDIDALMSDTAQVWCDTQLEDIGWSPTQPISDHARPHLTTYLDMRRRIDNHVQSQAEPVLELAKKARGIAGQSILLRYLVFGTGFS